MPSKNTKGDQGKLAIEGNSDPSGVLQKEAEEKKRLADEEAANRNDFLSELNSPTPKLTKES